MSGDNALLPLLPLLQVAPDMGVTGEAQATNKPKVCALLATESTPRALQKQMSELLPGLDIVLFGRAADFARALREPPDAALAIEPVLKFHRLVPKLHGLRAGATTEPYALVGVGSMPSAQTVNSLGIVDLFGREGLPEFVRSLLGRVPRLEPLVKLVDALPLLQLGNAEAVLLPLVAAKRLTGRTSLDLRFAVLDRQAGLPAAAPAGPQGAGAVLQLRSAPAAFLHSFGIEGFQ